MIERYDSCDFEIFGGNVDGIFIYYYEIYGTDNETEESNERFLYEQEARFAAIGHITNLQNGEGQ